MILHVHVSHAANLRARTVALEPGATTHAHALISYVTCSVGGARPSETRAQSNEEGGHVIWQEQLACRLELLPNGAESPGLLELPLRVRVHAAPLLPDAFAAVSRLDAARRPWDDGTAAYISRAVRRYELVGEGRLMLDARMIRAPCWVGIVADRVAHAGELLVRAWLEPRGLPSHLGRLLGQAPAAPLRMSRPGAQLLPGSSEPAAPETPPLQQGADGCSGSSGKLASAESSPLARGGRLGGAGAEAGSCARPEAQPSAGGGRRLGGSGGGQLAGERHRGVHSAGAGGSPQRPALFDAYGFRQSNGAAGSAPLSAAGGDLSGASAQRLALRWERQSAAWFDALTSPHAVGSARLPVGSGALAEAPAGERAVAQEGACGNGDRLEWARLVAVGVPLELRQRVWADFSGAAELRASAEAHAARARAEGGGGAWPLNGRRPKGGSAALCSYAQLIARLGEAGAEHVRQIEIDLPRTFPGHRALADPASLGPLRRVLCAYAVRDPERGYTQSLNFIAAFALLFADEAGAFWLLCAVAERLLPAHFAHGMVGVQLENRAFSALARAHPALVGAIARLDALGAELALVSTPWFMALYTTALPAEAVLRVWDLLFFHGPDALLAIGLALLLRTAPQLQACAQLEHAYEALKQLHAAAADTDALIALAVDQLGRIRGEGGLRALRSAELRALGLELGRQHLARLAYALAREHGRSAAAVLRPLAQLPDGCVELLAPLGAGAAGLATACGLGGGAGSPAADGSAAGAAASVAERLCSVWVPLARKLLSPCWRHARLTRRLCAKLAASAARDAQPLAAGSDVRRGQPPLLAALHAALAPAADERTRLLHAAYATAHPGKVDESEPALSEQDLAELVADAAELVWAASARAEHEAVGRAFAALALSGQAELAERNAAASRGALDLQAFARFAAQQPHLLELLGLGSQAPDRANPPAPGSQYDSRQSRRSLVTGRSPA